MSPSQFLIVLGTHRIGTVTLDSAFSPPTSDIKDWMKFEMTRLAPRDWHSFFSSPLPDAGCSNHKWQLPSRVIGIEPYQYLRNLFLSPEQHVLKLFKGKNFRIASD